MQENKYLIRLFMVFLFFTLFSSAFLLLPDWTKNPQQSLSSKNIPIVLDKLATGTIIKADTIPDTIVATSSTKQKIITPQNTSTPLSTTTTAAEIITLDENNTPINTTIEINDQKYNLKLKENSTTYDAIRQLVNDQKITAVMKEFKGMGYFMEEINGVKSDIQNNKYWIYYINGQSAKMGMSSYVLKNNDLITWKYETSKF